MPKTQAKPETPATVDLNPSALVLRRTQTRLEESLDRYADLYDFAPVGYLSLEEDGCIQDVNLTAATMLGGTRTEITGKSFFDYLAESQRQLFRAHLKKCLETCEKQTFEAKLQAKDGQTRWAEVTTIRVSGVTPAFSFRAALNDITERREVEQELITISTREQQRIGQDLHDSLSQNLTGISFLAKGLEQILIKKNLLKEAMEARQIVELLNETILQTRDLTAGLLSWKIESHGLAASLEELVAGIQNVFKVHCILSFDPVVIVLNIAEAKHVYRIVQEALHHAIRYSHARSIRVEVVRKNRLACLTVQDDGTAGEGADPERGMGLRIMNYRAKMIGAMLRTELVRGGGTLRTFSWLPAKPRLTAKKNLPEKALHGVETRR